MVTTGSRRCIYDQKGGVSPREAMLLQGIKFSVEVFTYARDKYLFAQHLATLAVWFIPQTVGLLLHGE